MELVAAAYAGYEAEPRRRGESIDWRIVLTVGNHAARGAAILLDSREPGSLERWRPVVTDWADRVAYACHTAAAGMRGVRGSARMSPVDLPAPDPDLVDIYLWLSGVANDLRRLTRTTTDR